MDFADDSDVEVFEGHSMTSDPPFARTNSSSSSRKSSYEGAGGLGVGLDDKLSDTAPDPSQDEIPMEASDDPSTIPPPPGPPNPPTVVEWKPQGLTEEEEEEEDEEVGVVPPTHSPQNGYPSTEGVADSSPQGGGGDLKELYGSTVTVTIDPPLDEEGGGADEAMSQYLDGRESCSSKNRRSLAELFGRGDSEVEEAAENLDRDLFQSLDEMDLTEEEDNEPPPPTKICLLSK